MAGRGLVSFHVGRSLPLLMLLLTAGARPSRLVAPAPPEHPCPANPLCACRGDHLACDYVPFHRFPETEAGAVHVALWGARLGVLGPAALDSRPLRTLVLVACHLHHVDAAALASMASSLASLDLGYNEFTQIPIKALSHLKVLNWVSLQNNYISDIDPFMDWGGLSESLSSLSLSNNHLCVIRQGAFSSLQHLVHIDLDGNRIRQLDAISLPPSLVMLRLSDNLLSQLPCSALAFLPRVRHLHLRNNILQPASNVSCRNDRSRVESLDLSHNELGDNFQFNFHYNLELKQLLLDLNDFTSVPPFVLDCSRLEKLSISYNNLQYLSEAVIYSLKQNLERLDLDYNVLSFFPQNIGELENLKHLSVAYNRFEDIKRLPRRLQSLSVAGNYLNSFPTGLRDLAPASLLYLDLGYNLISYVILDLFDAWSDGLTTLSLRGNRLAQLGLGSFPPLPLRELVLSFNDLHEVEAAVFSNLTDLKVLELSSTLFYGEIFSSSSFGALRWLNLDNNNIHSISTADLQNFPFLEYLNLDFNKITDFPSVTDDENVFYKLRELRLSYNYLSKINPQFLQDMSELQSVDVSYNHITNISGRAFSNLHNLVYLGLLGNSIECIAEEAFAYLQKLEVLDLQENKLTEFSMKYFTNVSNDDINFAVNVSHNRIVTLSGGEIVPIKVFDVSYNALDSISKNFFDSLGKHIRQIILSHNKLVSIDTFAFCTLPNLNVINLQENKIIAIKRRVFSEMPSLEVLDLSHNRISQLSVEQFHSLHRLRILRLDYNMLRALPRDVFKNTLIEYLDLSNNRLPLLPSSAFAQIGFTLRRLELSNNNIEYLDVAMFQATAFLHELGLSRNALTVLSDNTFAGVPRLRRLDLSYNALKTNFKELFQNLPLLRRLSLAGAGIKGAPHLPLANLTELKLSENYIFSFGESDMRHLRNLRALDISGNKFTSCRPAMWAALPSLISLDLSRNPIVRIQRGCFDGLDRLLDLKMDRLRYLETIEPRAFYALGSLRSLALESPTGVDRDVPIANIVSAAPHLEAMVIQIRKESLDKQLLGLRAPKLRSLEVRGAAMKRVAAHAFAALGRQRALTLRLTESAVSDLPAGLAAPLIRVPHLALDLTDNRLSDFEPAALYLNSTDWRRYATKFLPGGLRLGGNPLRCGCSAGWTGAWLRRWSSEVGGGSRGARAAARRARCLGAEGARPLLALPDDSRCHASALSGRSRAARHSSHPRPLHTLVGVVLMVSFS